MKKECAIFGFLFFVMMVLSFAAAENVTDNQTIILNETLNQSVNETVVGQTPAVLRPEITLISVAPKEFKIGDNQFNIQVQNNLDSVLKNVALLVTGKGFSTSDVVSIDSLDPKEKGYVLILGNFKEAGNITLKIQRAGDVFYYNITVIDANSGKAQELQEQQDKAALIQNYSLQLADLKQNYTELEDLLNAKKEDNFDVSKVNLDDLKKYLRTVQSAILTGDMNSAKVNLNLAAEEYADQKAKLDSVKAVPFLNRIKDNLALVGAIAASILTLFTFYELVKKKKKEVSETIVSRIKKKEESEEKK